MEPRLKNQVIQEFLSENDPRAHIVEDQGMVRVTFSIDPDDDRGVWKGLSTDQILYWTRLHVLVGRFEKPLFELIDPIQKTITWTWPSEVFFQ